MKRERQILSEDEYAIGLANVIERDFFPELQDLRDLKDYMVAERLDDQRKIQEIQFRKRQRSGIEETPFPESEEQAKPPEPEPVAPPGFSSVDAYLGTYTSEDNASFKVLQEEELRKRKEQDVWGKKQAELQEREASKKALLLEDRKDKEKVLALEYGNQQLLGLIPVEKSKEIYERQIELAAHQSVERVIDPKNTRFTAEDIKRLNELPKSKDPNGKRKKLNEIVQRNRFLQEGDVKNQIQQVDLDDLFPVEDEEQIESEPKINGFGFISTPQIIPGVGVDASPIVSWGTVDVLNIDTKGRHFTIPEVPERDRVAQKLTESVSYAAEKMKQRGATPILGKTPVFSPAGQKLLDERKKSLTMQSPFFKTPIGTPSAMKKQSSGFLTPKIMPRKKEDKPE